MGIPMKHGKQSWDDSGRSSIYEVMHHFAGPSCEEDLQEACWLLMENHKHFESHLDKKHLETPRPPEKPTAFLTAKSTWLARLKYTSKHLHKFNSHKSSFFGMKSPCFGTRKKGTGMIGDSPGRPGTCFCASNIQLVCTATPARISWWM